MTMPLMATMLQPASLQPAFGSFLNRVSFQGNQVSVNLSDLTASHQPMKFRVQRGFEIPAGFELIRLEEPSVSRQHAEIIYAVGSRRLILKDLDSSNGVVVNGRKVTGPHQSFDIPPHQDSFAFQMGAVEVVLYFSKETAQATPSAPAGDLRLVPPPSAQPHPLLGKEPPTAKPAEPILFRSTASTPGRGDLSVRLPPGTPDRVVNLVSDYLNRFTNLDRPGHSTVNLEVGWSPAAEFHEDAYVKLARLRARRFDVQEGLVLLKGEEGKTVEMDFTAMENGIIGSIRPQNHRATPIVRMIFPWPEVSTPQSELGLLTQLKKAFQRVNGYLDDRPELSGLEGVFLV